MDRIPSELAPGLASLLVESAHRADFPLAGVVDIDLALPAFRSHAEKFDRWLSDGHAGSMTYLVRGRDRRADPRLVFADAKSILCVALQHSSQPAGASDAKQGPRYARYLQGPDYHVEVAERLESMLREVSAEWTHAGGAPLRWKACVDTSAVLERSWAALAGLGWIGKNTLLIHPKLGSYLLLAEVLLNQETGQPPAPMKNLCGQCRRCLDACPTQAFVSAGDLNATRCISYWTLEKRGELPIEEGDKRKIGPWIAGCDICQEVCPFNSEPSRLALPGLDDSSALQSDWQTLLVEREEAYRQRSFRSALNRVKPAEFRRNLAITLRNALAEVAAEDLADLQRRLLPLLRNRLEEEKDDVARAEWQRCIAALEE